MNDSNWGRHGNPNNENWYKTQRELPEYRERRIFSRDPIKIGLYELFLILSGFLLLSGLIPELRDWVYSGFNFTENWYNAVDAILDAMHAPQVPH